MTRIRTADAVREMRDAGMLVGTRQGWGMRDRHVKMLE